MFSSGNANHYSARKLDLAERAAAYGFGLSNNHPFNYANYIAALITKSLLLKLNGYDLGASHECEYKTSIRDAASLISEAMLMQ